MWSVAGVPDLDQISKTFSHLLIVEDNEENYIDFTYNTNSFLKKQIQSKIQENTFAVGLGQSLGVVMESGQEEKEDGDFEESKTGLPSDKT